MFDVDCLDVLRLNTAGLSHGNWDVFELFCLHSIMLILLIKGSVEDVGNDSCIRPSLEPKKKTEYEIITGLS